MGIIARKIIMNASSEFLKMDKIKKYKAPNKGKKCTTLIDSKMCFSTYQELILGDFRDKFWFLKLKKIIWFANGIELLPQNLCKSSIVVNNIPNIHIENEAFLIEGVTFGVKKLTKVKYKDNEDY